ncbi:MULTISPECIES: hypothetical protein [Protofrankia]|uniref:Uncharacterized protein n=1 Tax=Candidatus Protofrankia datiscae TaxID=2716812 RepID=F8AZ06_9ACTN|nr:MULTISPECIES: hypothetical protein [Protofrankia]AEH09594.1 hypothetical protein FsymDg_2184 [Candidatus Protofrankia datiscae]
MTGPAGRVDDTGRVDGNGAGALPCRRPPATGATTGPVTGAPATHETRIMVDVPDQPGGFLAVPEVDPRRRVDLHHKPVLEPALRDPDLDDPLIAAVRYRALLAELNQARNKVEDRMSAGRQRRAALAQAHRESAEAIRAKVDEVWRTVAEPLAHHGISSLDQLRPPPVERADDVPAVAAADHDFSDRYLSDHDVPGHDVAGHDVAGRTSDRDIPVVTGPGRGHGPGGRPIARAQHRRGEPGRARPAGGAAPQRRARTRQVVRAASAGAAVPFEPSEAPGRAHELCLIAMGHAAELRAVTRSGSSASAAIVIGLGCLLVAGGVTVLRVLFGVAALPSLTGAAVLTAVGVAVATDVARVEVARAALLGAGTAGAAVLATIRVASLDPTDVIASLVALVLALRFGLGVGAPRHPQRK